MDGARIKAKYDWLVEIGGAVAPGLAAGFAALKLAPSFGLAPATAMAAGGATGIGLGLLAMRAVRPSTRRHALPGFAIEPVDALAEEPLLLEELAEALAEDGVLLLDDPLLADPDSRVVHLFASPPPPTPGQLKQRIDRHLAEGAKAGANNGEVPLPDASEALYAALAELRRSLR